MAQKPRIAENVVPLFDDAADLPEEIEVGHKLIPEAPAIASRSSAAIDLSGRPKVMLAFGTGASGKTHFLRWVSEQLLERGSTAKLAAIDPENRDLKGYFSDGVHEPESHDATQVADWLRAFFDAMVREKWSGLIDTGGGDTAFGQVFAHGPGLVEEMEAEGIAVVAAYLFSSRYPASLSALSTLSSAGFLPPATALILNEGTVEGGKDVEREFAPIRRHSVYRAAIDRGAVELWMPKLLPAKKIEDRRLQFRHAAGLGPAPDGKRSLGWSDKIAVRAWLARMKVAMDPISTWIP
jgi:hypothetical protein